MAGHICSDTAVVKKAVLVDSVVSAVLQSCGLRCGGSSPEAGEPIDELCLTLQSVWAALRIICKLRSDNAVST